MRFILYNKSFYAKYSIASASTYFFSDGDKLLHIYYTVIKYSFFCPSKTKSSKDYEKNSRPDYNGVQNLETKIQTPVFIIVNHNGEFFKRGTRRLTSWLYLLLPTLSNHFQKIESDLEKAELIVEIESSYISKSNPILPFITFITLSLIPYYEEIEFKEDFRILKKTGEIVFQANRFKKVDRWFGIIFIFHGVIGFIEDGNRNFPSESTMMRRVNENILQELKSKNF